MNQQANTNPTKTTIFTQDTSTTTYNSDSNLVRIHQSQPGKEFGVVVVAGWPPPIEELQTPYSNFLDKVKQCFDGRDFEIDPNVGITIPNVYLYPVQHLHVTVATFRRFNDVVNPPTSSSTQQEQSAYLDACSKIMQAAFARDDWPPLDSNIVLKAHHAQIGSNAGIVLWKEDVEKGEGWFGKMRSIIQEEVDYYLAADGGGTRNFSLSNTFTCPSIIHSTFLRFGNQPLTESGEIQEKFNRIVLEKNSGSSGSTVSDSGRGMEKIFGDTAMRVNSVRLVVERTPYMHLPCDEHHVLKTFEFS